MSFRQSYSFRISHQSTLCTSLPCKPHALAIFSFLISLPEKYFREDYISSGYSLCNILNSPILPLPQTKLVPWAHLFLDTFHLFCFPNVRDRRSQWLRGLRRRSAAARLLRLWVRIPPGHGCLSVVSVVCCQVEVSATSWSLVRRSPTNCGASLCVI